MSNLILSSVRAASACFIVVATGCTLIHGNPDIVESKEGTAGRAGASHGSFAGNAGTSGSSGATGTLGGMPGASGDTGHPSGGAITSSTLGSAGANTYDPTATAGSAGTGGSVPSSTGGTAASNSSGGSSTVGGAATTAACSAGQTRACDGALGSCALGVRPCVSGQWGECSIQPALADTCTPLNDDNCNGTPNDAACSIKQISAGGSHTCALLSDGMVRCWGANDFGQLASSDPANSAKPFLVSGLKNVVYVVAGKVNTCVILADNSVWCWGSNEGSQLGTGASSSVVAAPVQLVMPTGLQPSVIALGTNHACLLDKTNGGVWCWGDDQYGQLGNGNASTAASKTLVQVTGLTDIRSIAAGDTHVCAVTATGNAVSCWGRNNYGQLGDGGPTGSPEPFAVYYHAYPLSSVADITSGSNGQHVCTKMTDTGALCWGYSAYGQLGDNYIEAASPNPVYVYDMAGIDPLANVSSISAGGNHTCALLQTGAAVCWGLGTSGQLGNSTNVSAQIPVAVSSLADAVTISAGGGHTCALITGNTSMKCWGSNRSGELGDATTTVRNAPVKVLNLLPGG